MEEVLARFPHLGDKIFQNLNSHTLIRCKEVNKSWENFIKVEKSCYLRIIKWYTNYSEPLIKKIIEKFGGAIIAVSILREIFRSNRPLLIGWHMLICQGPGGNWKYYMNHTTKFTKDFRDPTKSLPDGWVWSTTPEGTICYIHLSDQVVTWHEHPISQAYQPKRPQFVQNHGQWELIWDNLTGKHRQRLLQFQRLKWTMAISENFPNCNAGLLLSFFGLELPQEVGEGILEPTVISLSLFLNDSGVESFKYIHRSQTL